MERASSAKAPGARMPACASVCARARACARARVRASAHECARTAAQPRASTISSPCVRPAHPPGSDLGSTKHRKWKATCWGGWGRSGPAPRLGRGSDGRKRQAEPVVGLVRLRHVALQRGGARRGGRRVNVNRARQGFRPQPRSPLLPPPHMLQPSKQAEPRHPQKRQRTLGRQR